MRRLLILLLLPLFSTAQQANVTKFTAERAGIVILKDVEDKYNANVYNLEAPSPDGDKDRIRLRRAKEEIARKYPHRRSRSARKATATVPVPVVEREFVSDSFSGIPPDNDFAVSKDNKAVGVLNSNIAVLDATNGNMSYRRSLKFFSLRVGLNGFNDNRYDPKIQYDPSADRFICVMLNGRDADNWIVVAFSMSNDPEGAWAFYKFYGDYKNDTTWFDYPGVVITEDELFLTGNKIGFNQPWETGFSETVIYQINKQDGYDSVQNLNYQIWDGITYGGESIRNLFPVRPARQLQGPEQYFLSNRNFDVTNDTIFLVKIPDTMGSVNNNLTITQLSSPIHYGVPPNGRQPDTNYVLSTNDGRILGAYATDDQIQFVSTSVDTNNGASGVFHAVIDNYKTSPAITHANIFSVDTLDFGYPNIQYAGDSSGVDYSIISYNYTGPNTYPGLGVMMNFKTDYSDMVKVKEGDSSIYRLFSKEQRWGDYTGAQVDFNYTSMVWINGIYGRADNNYGNWAALIKNPSPYLSVENTQEPGVVPQLSKVYPNPAFEMINFQFYIEEAGPVSFYIHNTEGKLVDEVLSQKVKKGNNEIRFNTAHLPEGVYYIKAILESGEAVMNEKFIKL